jgi:hypothetical protein
MRDDSMNAANPFSANQFVALGLPGKPKDRRQQFGGSLGGPIKKDKLFYFEELKKVDEFGTTDMGKLRFCCS